VQKRTAKANRIGKTSRVLHPTSGPAAPISSKKARKLEKAENHARQRALEKAMAEQGEVVMTDAPKTAKSKRGDEKKSVEGEQMEVDGIA